MHIHLTMYFFKIYIINILDRRTLKCGIAPTLVGTLDLATMSLYDLERFHEIGIMMKEDWKRHLEQWTGPALMSVSRFFDDSEPAVKKWAGNLFARRCYLSGQLWMTIRISRRRDVNESGGRDTPQHQWVNKNLFCSLLWLWLGTRSKYNKTAMFGVWTAKTNVVVAAVAWRPAQLYTSPTHWAHFWHVVNPRVFMIGATTIFSLSTSIVCLAYRHQVRSGRVLGLLASVPRHSSTMEIISKEAVKMGIKGPWGCHS